MDKKLHMLLFHDYFVNILIVLRRILIYRIRYFDYYQYAQTNF